MKPFSVSIDSHNTIFCENEKVTYVSVNTPSISGSANRSEHIFYVMLSDFIRYLPFEELTVLIGRCSKDDILKKIILERITSQKRQIELLEKLINS